MEKWRYLWTRMYGKLWLRATLYCLLGVATALVGALARDLIPPGLALQVGADALGNILGIVAASMLAVTTFSLSIMVSAYSSAANSATPRATQLLMQDSNAQSFLSTFVGAFLFSVVGIIALSAGIYGDGGRVILFAITLLVIVLITVTLLRAIDQFPRFGRLGDTIGTIERATLAALERRAADPALGGVPWDRQPVSQFDVEVQSPTVGYVDFVDIAAINALAEAHNFNVCVIAPPGTLAGPGRPLARLDRKVEAEVAADIAAAYAIANGRNIHEDPRYGLVVLAEVGVRAGSSAVNDPGTAIDVIHSLTRVLAHWATLQQRHHEKDVRYPRVRVAVLREADMYNDAFPALARDNAGLLEVGVRLQKALATLCACGHAESAHHAHHHAQRALQRGLEAMAFADDRAVLVAVAAKYNQVHPDTPA